MTLKELRCDRPRSTF